MSAPAFVLISSATLLALFLLIPDERGRGIRFARIVLLLAAVLTFGVAGWLLGREERSWLGYAVVLFGFVWTGFLWVVSIGRRLSRAPVADDRSEAVRRGSPRPASARTGGGLEPPEREIFTRLVAMSERTIGSLATPRDKIVSADCARGVAEALERMRGSHHLRIPMTDGSLDRIVGVVHAKDVVPFALDRSLSRPLKNLMRKPLFVSRETTVADLLELFRSQRGHLAIVVDVYNRTLGLVSRADLFRHLSGGDNSG